jgi:SAM-dependent methyltransferase
MGRVSCWTPLGAALAAFHGGRRDEVLLVASDLWEDEAAPVAAYYRPDDQDLPDVERRALDLCRGRVLDLGAGAGRHALEIQRLGLPVTAVDVCREATAVMRARGVRDVRRGDLEAVSGERFDTVLMMMHGLGIVGDRSGLRSFLRRVPAVLAPGGQVLADSADLLVPLREAGYGRATARRLSRAPVRFRLTFDGLRGEPYDWFFVPPDLLREEARRAGLGMEVVATGDRGTYLARLSAAG